MSTPSLTAAPSSQPDLCVFIGRFQPPHKGHGLVIQAALDRGRYALVIPGSANEPRTCRNPFTAADRVEMIQAMFPDEGRLFFWPLEDSNYDPAGWVQATVDAVTRAWTEIRDRHPDEPETPRVALIGHAKDATSYYLRLFPQWESIEVPQDHVLSATSVRHRLFGDLALALPRLEADDAQKRPQGLSGAERVAWGQQREQDYLDWYAEHARIAAMQFLDDEARLANTGQSDLLPGVIDFLRVFATTEAFRQVAYEHAHVAKYAYAWRHAPYAPFFVTGDALVLHERHVLMVRRARYPGKGLWALPGGFVEVNEPVEAAALRELAEETEIALSPAFLRQHIVKKEVIDAPFRSSRGRTITHAVRIDLPDGPRPATKAMPEGGDEESFELAWVDLNSLQRDRCFEDHYAIIRKLTRDVPALG